MTLNQTIEHLISDTQDLLYRIRIYDRNLAYADEIAAMDDKHTAISAMSWSSEMDPAARNAIEQLAAMKLRLLTMFEDLLFIA